MAEIRDDLVLDIDQALRQIDQLERSLDDALQPIDVRIDPTTAQRQLDDLARNAEQALGDVDVNIDSSGAARLNDELAGVERNLTGADREADQLAASLREADRAADDINVTANRTVGVFGGLRTAALGIAAALAAVGAGQLFSAAIRGANAAVQQYATLQDSLNAVRVVFGQASDSVLAFGETSAQSAGLAQSAFNQAVVPIGSLLQNFGFDAREAADASLILVQRAADMASVLGGSVTEALTAVGAALRGEADPLERYGASVSAARVEQFALAQGLAATKAEITPAITLQARYGVILQDTQRFAGDFVNTATDLANAQKIVSEEATETSAAFGEALAPAFELILAQAVPVLQFFESLSVALGETATEAAGAASALPEVISAIVLGFGALGDIFGAGGDIASGFVAGVDDVLNALIDWDFSFSGIRDQMDDFNQRTANQFIRIASQSIPAALARGTSPINAFGTAIEFLAEQDDGLRTVEQSFGRLRIQAGLTDPELQAVTRSLLSQADALELSAGEIVFLQGELNALNESLDTGGRANADYLASVAGFPGVFETATTTFTTFAGELESGTDRAGAALAELAAAAERQQARTAAAFNLFEDLPEQISGSFTAAVDALRDQVESISEFEINLAILRAFDLDALAADFADKGIAFAGQLEQAINDIPTAIEANELLQGMGVIGEEAFAALVERFISVGLTPSDARALAEELEFASPEVINAAVEAGKSIAAAQAGSYQDSLSSELDQLIPETGREIGDLIDTHWRLEDEANRAAQGTASSFLDGIKLSITPQSVLSALDLFGIEVDLTDTGIDAGVTLINGMVIGVSSPSSVNRLRDSVVDATRNALEMQSPSRIMLDLGELAGDSFWQGFNQADLSLRTALPSITGGLATGTVPGSITGANVALTINHPTMNDAVSDAARLAQIAGSVATTFNSVRPN